jgi:hypothetical protein
VPTDYLLGIAKTEGRVKLLLNIDRVLTTNEVVALPILAAASQEVAAE